MDGAGGIRSARAARPTEAKTMTDDELIDAMIDVMTEEEFFQWGMDFLPGSGEEYEDELARRLGAYRHPSLDVKEWRF